MIEITKEILNKMLKEMKICFSGEIRFSSSPTINISGHRKYSIKDIDGNYPKDLPGFPTNFSDIEIAYFKEKASKRIANCVVFTIENSEVSEIKEYWDEEIIIDFNNLLPKSKRGKIKPWYDSEEVWERYLQMQKINLVKAN